MSLIKRINDVQGKPPPRRLMNDDSVLEDLIVGVVDDRHLDWLDGLYRQAIITNFCLQGMLFRAHPDAATIDTSQWRLGAGLGIRVFACRSNEPVPLDVEKELSRGIYHLSIPDRAASDKYLLGRSPDGPDLARLWLRSRLVTKAIGPDLGRSMRAGLDRLADSEGNARWPFDLRRPHADNYDRLLRFDDALHEPADVGLLFPAPGWVRIERSLELHKKARS